MLKKIAPWTDSSSNFLRASRAGNLEKVLEYLDGHVDINTSNANGLTALHLASKEGHIDIVTELVQRGATVDATTKKGNTALHIASLAGQVEVVKILVQKGSDINAQAMTGGFTPLYMAAQENHVEVVKHLLSCGANPTITTDDGFTPLAVALQQGHDQVVARLLESDTRGRVKLPALHIAAKKDDTKAATLLLQSEHNVNQQSKSGFTPLHIACHYGNVSVGSLLIDNGADINFKARNQISPLHVASKWGKINMVRLLLDHNAAIDTQTRDGLTALHCAARSGHDQVVDLLLERGATVDSKTKNKLSPLHMAAQGDHVDCARLLLMHKAPIDDKTVDFLTPLHVAAHCGNHRTAKLLLDRKCEPDSRALNGFTPLHIACKKNRIKVIELLLKYGASIEATTETGLTPLHVAAFMGHMNIVVHLLQNGANPDTPTTRGETALHHAARANQTDIMRVLLRNGAKVDAKAREDQTALHIASRLGNVDNVQLLLQHGAAVDAQTKDQYTPLHIAAKEGHEEVAVLLLDAGANQELNTKKGFTPLHIASKYGKKKVVALLLDRGSDPNVSGKNGLTPLHVATHYSHPDVAVLLLEKKASPKAAAKNGYTPLHIAAKKNQMDIATSLLEYSADPNAESKNGFTPLHLAAQEGHTDMVSLLLEQKAEVNKPAKNGLTPMHLAAQEDKVPVAEVLVKYDAQIDPQTKAGYTPLHTACHFGQINMIRFLLEHGADVNAKTKLGYTPLHQAAQQGHVLVINLLLKYDADPNAVANNGQTPLSLAQRLGYISVVEILKNITDAKATEHDPNEKYKVQSPETMQEGMDSDSDEEGVGELLELEQSYAAFPSEKPLYLPYHDGTMMNKRDDTIIGDQSMTYMSTELGDDSIAISPVKDERDLSYLDRYSTGRDSMRDSFREASHFSEGYSRLSEADKGDGRLSDGRLSDGRLSEADKGDGGLYSPRAPQAPPIEWQESVFAKEEKLQAAAAVPGYMAEPGRGDSGSAQFYGSYSGVSFGSSYDTDNIALDRHPIFSGFLVSFMVDARGGAMRGCRHSGVRIIIPPGKASMPTRVTCKLVKKEKLIYAPPLMEGEALASRVLEMGPVGAKFDGPVILEVPHFASLRNREREVVILRSDDGEHWKEHPIDATEDAIQTALGSSFEDLETAEELYHKRITRILTDDFPQYFAIVTRIRQENSFMGPEGGMVNSTVVPQVQAIFPPDALTKRIKVGLQAQPIPPEQVSKLFGNRVAVSPVVTVEPRRRKFHRPITLTIPLPKAAKPGMINQYDTIPPTLRLLCSITGGAQPAVWEDITTSHQVKKVGDCIQFDTSVSARFWLIDCPNTNEATTMASEIYQEAVAVPFMSKFVVFAKRHETQEARLRVFCMTDDKMDKTLESQEHFAEVARSRDVEVLEGKPQYVEMGGNIVPVTKSGDQLYINFHAFRENRLPFTVRIRDSNQNAEGRVAFMRDPKSTRADAPQNPICTLNIKLPETIQADTHSMMSADERERKYRILTTTTTTTTSESISRAELRLSDIANHLQDDWPALAQELGLTDEQIGTIQNDYGSNSEQALVMLHLWVQDTPSPATGNELERALERIGRQDIIRKCIHNVEEVTDDLERELAKGHLKYGDKTHLPTEDSLQTKLPQDMSLDDKDFIKEAESADESSSDRGSVVDRQRTPQAEDAYPPYPTLDTRADDEIIPHMDERRGVIVTPNDDDLEEQSRMKREAYIEFAMQMEDTLDSQDARLTHPADYTQHEFSGDEADEGPITSNIREQPDQQPIEDLILALETQQEQGMDDRVYSSEEDLVITGEIKKDKQEPLKSEPLQAEAAYTFEAEKPATPPSSPVTTLSGGEEEKLESRQMMADPDMYRQGHPAGQTTTTFSGLETTDYGDQRMILRAQGSSEHSSDMTPDELYRYPSPDEGPDQPDVRIYTDTLEGEPQVSTAVEEFEEELPDGTIVKRKITKTTQRQTITSRVIMEGPEGELPTEEEFASASMKPALIYKDEGQTEPETSTEVQESEEVLPDGTVVKRRVVTSTEQMIDAQRTVVEGPSPPPEFTRGYTGSYTEPGQDEDEDSRVRQVQTVVTDQTVTTEKSREAGEEELQREEAAPQHAPVTTPQQAPADDQLHRDGVKEFDYGGPAGDDKSRTTVTTTKTVTERTVTREHGQEIEEEEEYGQEPTPDASQQSPATTPQQAPVTTPQQAPADDQLHRDGVKELDYGGPAGDDKSRTTVTTTKTVTERTITREHGQDIEEEEYGQEPTPDASQQSPVRTPQQSPATTPQQAPADDTLYREGFPSDQQLPGDFAHVDPEFDEKSRTRVTRTEVITERTITREGGQDVVEEEFEHDSAPDASQQAPAITHEQAPATTPEQAPADDKVVGEPAGDERSRTRVTKTEVITERTVTRESGREVEEEESVPQEAPGANSQSPAHEQQAPAPDSFTMPPRVAQDELSPQSEDQIMPDEHKREFQAPYIPQISAEKPVSEKDSAAGAPLSQGTGPVDEQGFLADEPAVQEDYLPRKTSPFQPPEDDDMSTPGGSQEYLPTGSEAVEPGRDEQKYREVVEEVVTEEDRHSQQHRAPREPEQIQVEEPQDFPQYGSQSRSAPVDPRFAPPHDHLFLTEPFPPKDQLMEESPDDLTRVSPLPPEYEMEETLADGSVVRRQVLSQSMKKTVTRKIRRVGPDGEVIEDVITEEIPESDLMSDASTTSSLHSSLSDARDLTSPIPMSPSGAQSPVESDSELGGAGNSSVRVYSDTIEGEPEVETDVQEFEETLPDGTVVKRRVIKTKQKQVIVRRVVMEGPESDLPTSQVQAQQMLAYNQSGFEPSMQYSDHSEGQPVTDTNVSESEEVLDDGTVVKRKTIKSTSQQTRTERKVLEATSPPPELMEIGTKTSPDAAEQVREDDVVPEAMAGRAFRAPVVKHQMSDQSDDFVEAEEAPADFSRPPGQRDDRAMVDEPQVVPDLKVADEHAPTITVTEDDRPPADEEDFVKYYGLENFTKVQEDKIPGKLSEEDGQGLPSPSYREGDEVAAFGDDDEEMETTRVVMKKHIHKKTIIRDGKEETLVTEDTQVEQDNEGPEELRQNMQAIIDQFMSDAPQQGIAGEESQKK